MGRANLHARWKESAGKKIKIEDRMRLGEESSMTIWFPKIQKLDIPQPRTVSTELPPYEQQLMAIADPGLLTDTIQTARRVAEQMEFPLFMRGDGTSCKHEWEKTCYVENLENIGKNLHYILETTELMGMMGELKNKRLYFREFLKLERAGFTAFGFGLPITKEFRCFIRDGKIQCMHPYWFEDAIRGVDSNNWKKLLEKNNRLGRDESQAIHAHLEKLCKIFDGYWSADFAKGTNGLWYLIDMARGEVSYHHKSCRHAGEFDHSL